jgi:hypothetical protein
VRPYICTLNRATIGASAPISIDLNQHAITVNNVRYCGQELVFETKPEPFLIQIPCHRCRYVTVVEASTMRLTIHQIYQDCLQGLTPPSLVPSDDGKTVVSYLRVIADTLLAPVIERIRIDLPIARSALVSVFSRRERLLQERISHVYDFNASLETRIFPKVALLLWSVLAQTGGLSPDVVRNFSSKGVTRFLGWFQPIADDITLLAETARSIRRGELKPRFDGSVFTFSKTPLHTAAVESTINSQLQRDTARPMHIEEVFSFEELECQRLVLGFTARDITELFFNRLENLKAHTEVVSERDIYWIRLPKNNPTLFKLLSLCTLTPEKLPKFRSPFFFDLGVPAEPAMSDRDALLNAVANNWSYYYPFCSMSETDGVPEYVATSHSLMVGFLANIETQKNTLAEQLVNASRRNGDSSAPDPARAWPVRRVAEVPSAWVRRWQGSSHLRAIHRSGARRRAQCHRSQAARHPADQLRNVGAHSYQGLRKAAG